MNVAIDLSNVVLKTERLILRPWKEEDLYDFYEYASVEGVGVMAGWNRHTSITESKTILDRFIVGKRTFAVEKDGKVIDSLGVEQYFERLFPELDSLKGRAIGYILSKDYWGQGLMPEAVKEV
ncbi:MAG TPA: GNAT family N-acetyltransferase, partial [Acholeplasmataceae bacterium]|nr:GNAT family N-acetyltransferase [Acholeplasmataceae bacterium]